MSLQRRLMVYLLVAAPLVWTLALGVSAQRARHEVNELFDSELIRLALQAQAIAAPRAGSPPDAQQRTVPLPAREAGEADLRDFALAVWDGEGRLTMTDREGVQLPRRAQASGFVDLVLDGDAWHVYYLQASGGESLVAVGQRSVERDEVVWNLVGSQLLPWLVVLPMLLAAIAWGVRRALSPVRALTGELGRRGAGELQPVAADDAPVELRPMVDAMNGLFARTAAALERERRFTADAAHELRTPLAALRAQWDVLRGAADADARCAAEARLGAGFERMERLVAQMLALSGVEATERLARREPIDWAAVVGQATSDCLALADRRRIEMACEWPPAGVAPMPLRGDADLVTVLLRNLLDNAVRYAPEGTTVTLRFGAQSLRVENAGPALAPDALAQLGERFHRPAGQRESGSGLGVSIAQRIAALHGLTLRYGAMGDGRGVVAELRSA
jgi:two-component system sensor histidine kinase QseC